MGRSISLMFISFSTLNAHKTTGFNASKGINQILAIYVAHIVENHSVVPLKNRPNLCIVHSVWTKTLAVTASVNIVGRMNAFSLDRALQTIFVGGCCLKKTPVRPFSATTSKDTKSFPILSYLYQNGIIPKVIPNGAKNMSVEIPACKIRMIDCPKCLVSTNWPRVTSLICSTERKTKLRSYSIFQRWSITILGQWRRTMPTRGNVSWNGTTNIKTTRFISNRNF